MAEVWYFAYGWSLDRSLFKRCVKRWIDEKKAALKGFRLVFDAYSPSWGGGVANLEEKKSSIVYGIAYKILDDQLRMLDEVEGVPARSARLSITIEVEGVGEVKAVTHVATNPRRKNLTPSKEYLAAMLRGVKQHDLGEKALEEIRRASRRGAMP